MNNKTWITLVSLFICMTVFSGVNLKNGNFYISFTDIKINSQYAAVEDITRTYNSKSTHIGIFGFGWGSEIETYIHSYPDGSIVLYQHGAGGKYIYNSEMTTDDMIEYMVDELIEESLVQGALDNNPNAIIERREKLFNDHDYRATLWDFYVENGDLEFESDFPQGMEWESYERGNEMIIKTENGFEKTKGNEIESFDIEGRLIKIDKGNGKWSRLEYTNGNLSKIVNADETEFLIEFNTEGFVEKIEIDESISAYTYNQAKYKYEEDDLIYNRDIAGSHYQFVYNQDHNMTKVVYNPIRTVNTPEDAQFMEYESKTMWISKITDRNGEIVSYSYDIFYKEDGTKDDDHYGTKVTKTDEYGTTRTNSYEYYIGIKESGERYSQKIITRIQGIETATTYDELCELPIEIERSNRKTTFKYNNRCLLVEKINDYDSIYMKYHPVLEKMTYVKNEQGEYHFEYDEKGNLTLAKRDDAWVQLIYNAEGKITEMRQEEQSLIFKYNDVGKPIKIEIEGVGGIDVTYDKYGEIERVSSEDGHQISLQVTQAFQKLLGLVKPSGVSLDM